MRALAVVLLLALGPTAAPAAAEDDPVKKCEDFFARFQACVDGLEGEQQEEARVFLKTLRGLSGMADGVNRGDPMLTGMMCGTMMDEAKKDPDIQGYKCQW